MNFEDIFLLLVRWLHLISATAWVGGGLFYLLVLRPVMKRTSPKPKILVATTTNEFQAVVNTSIVILVATGAILAFNRLTLGIITTSYVVTLAIKSAFSVWMFLIVLEQQRHSKIIESFKEPTKHATTIPSRIKQALSGYNLLVILGLIVFLMSDLLKILFETALWNI